MTAFLTYLLQVCLSVSLFLLIYLVVFRGKTFFQLNRTFLLIGLVLSFIIPIVTIPAGYLPEESVIQRISTDHIDSEYLPGFFSKEGAEGNPIDVATILAMAYVAGITVFIVRFLSGLYAMLGLKRKATRVMLYGFPVFMIESFPTCSFFHTIIASRGADRMEIEHEQIHIRQKHWIDRLVAEVASIILWFNPVMILYKRVLKNEHEFLADRAVISQTMDIESYVHCLLNATKRFSGIPVTSHFGSPTIKKRIVMLTKNQTPSYQTMFYFVIVPVIAFLLVAFQNSPLPTGTIRKTTIAQRPQNIPTGSPVDKASIKETFGFGRKFNNATKKVQNHTGIDFVTDEGVNVMATADGVIAEVNFNDLKGNFVVVRHSDEFVTQYYHLLKSTVKTGAPVKKGEVIGLVGSTGSYSTSNHLHYEVLRNNKPVDPADYLNEK